MAKLLQSTLFQSKGALMKVKKSRVLSAFVTTALVASMLPLGAIAAFADVNGTTNTYYNGGTTKSVVRGVGSAQSQAVCDVTVKEDSADSDEWDTVDREITVSTPSGATFAGKPTVKVNGTAATVTLDSSSQLHFDVPGEDGTRDEFVMSNIKLYVASVAGTTLALTVEDPSGTDNATTNSVTVAKVKDGLVVAVADKNTEVEIGEDNQTASKITMTESTTGALLESDDTFSMTCPDGVTFYESPEASETTNGFSLDSNIASLSADRKTATWTVNTVSDTTTAVMEVTPSINLASTVASGKDIEFTFAVSNSDYAIAPTPAKIAEATSGDDIAISADTAPNVSKSTNQPVGDITIDESEDGLLEEAAFTLTVDTTSCAFASTPQATPAGGLTLENSDGDNVTSAVAGTLSKYSSSKINRATWTIGDESTDANGGTINIKGIVLNVDSSATTGAIRMTLAGAGMSKTITVGYISTSSTVNVTASGAPAVKINVGDQAAGDITITETKAGALAAGDNGIVLKLFGVTADDEIKFSEAPTVSVASGDIDINTSGTLGNISSSSGTEAKFTVDVNTVSGKASTIKISGIKYDVNAKAVEGSVQVVVMNGDTRLATVTNATIGKTGQTFSDVASTFWASSYINKLNTKGIINGYNDGTFKPNGNITRAEFAKIAVTAANLTLSTTSTASFSDVPTTHWAFKYIETAKAAGFIGGYPDGTFRPDAQVNRAEICKMVIGAGKIATDTAGSGFSDTAGNWAETFIKTAAKNGIVGGYPDGTFGPAKNATRAEAAKMVSTWLKL
jgi:hypothetical protein